MKINKKIVSHFLGLAVLFGVIELTHQLTKTEEQTTYSVTLESLLHAQSETNGENGTGGGGTDGETGGTSDDSNSIYEIKTTECTAVTTTTWTTWGTVNGDLGASSMASLLANFGISGSLAVAYTHSREVTTKGFKRDCLIGGSNECTAFDCTA